MRAALFALTIFFGLSSPLAAVRPGDAWSDRWWALTRGIRSLPEPTDSNLKVILDRAALSTKKSVREAGRATLLELGQKAAPYLISQISLSTRPLNVTFEWLWHRRIIEAIEVLGLIRSQEAVPRLIEVVSDWTRHDMASCLRVEYACRALGAMQAVQARSALEALAAGSVNIADPSCAGLSAAATQALSQLGPQADWLWDAALADDKSPLQLEQALHEFIKSEALPPGLVSRVLDLTRHPEPKVRWVARAALRFGGAPARRAILAALEREPVSMNRSFLFHHTIILEPLLDPDLVPWLERALDDPDLRWGAATSLGKLATPEAMDALRKAWPRFAEDDDAWQDLFYAFRNAGGTPLEMLRPMIHQGSPKTRGRALQLAAELGQPGLAREAERLAEDPQLSAELRQEARRALPELRGADLREWVVIMLPERMRKMARSAGKELGQALRDMGYNKVFAPVWVAWAILGAFLGLGLLTGWFKVIDASLALPALGLNLMLGVLGDLFMFGGTGWAFGFLSGCRLLTLLGWLAAREESQPRSGGDALGRLGAWPWLLSMPAFFFLAGPLWGEAAGRFGSEAGPAYFALFLTLGMLGLVLERLLLRAWLSRKLALLAHYVAELTPVLGGLFYAWVLSLALSAKFLERDMQALGVLLLLCLPLAGLLALRLLALLPQIEAPQSLPQALRSPKKIRVRPELGGFRVLGPWRPQWIWVLPSVIFAPWIFAGGALGAMGGGDLASARIGEIVFISAVTLGTSILGAFGFWILLAGLLGRDQLRVVRGQVLWGRAFGGVILAAPWRGRLLAPALFSSSLSEPEARYVSTLLRYSRRDPVSEAEPAWRELVRVENSEFKPSAQGRAWVSFDLANGAPQAVSPESLDASASDSWLWAHWPGGQAPLWFEPAQRSQAVQSGARQRLDAYVELPQGVELQQLKLGLFQVEPNA